MRTCPVRRVPPLRRQGVAALRAIAGSPGGLRVGAYPVMMPLLRELGLVRARARGEPGWVLTPAGRRALAAYGADEG